MRDYKMRAIVLATIIAGAAILLPVEGAAPTWTSGQVTLTDNGVSGASANFTDFTVHDYLRIGDSDELRFGWDDDFVEKYVPNSNGGYFIRSDGAYVIPSTVTNIGGALNALFAAMPATGGHVLLPRGTYAYSETISTPVQKLIRISGYGVGNDTLAPGGSILRYTGAGNAFEAHGTAWDTNQVNLHLENFKITCEGTAGTDRIGISIRRASGAGGTLRISNVAADTCNTGWRFDGILMAQMVGIYARQNSGIGIHLTNANGASNANQFYGFSVESNGIGVQLDGEAFANAFVGGTIEGAGNVIGLNVSGSGAVAPQINTFRDIYMEGVSGATNTGILVTTTGSAYPAYNVFEAIQLEKYATPVHAEYGTANVFRSLRAANSGKSVIDANSAATRIEAWNDDRTDFTFDNSTSTFYDLTKSGETRLYTNGDLYAALRATATGTATRTIGLGTIFQSDHAAQDTAFAFKATEDGAGAWASWKIISRTNLDFASGFNVRFSGAGDGSSPDVVLNRPSADTLQLAEGDKFVTDTVSLRDTILGTCASGLEGQIRYASGSPGIFYGCVTTDAGTTYAWRNMTLST